jgi:hypothetical protein
VIAAIWMAVLAAAVSSADQTLNSEHKVEYVVTTNDKASVSYWTSGGTSNQDVAADWTKEQTVKNSDFLSLVVTGDYTNANATVGCEILFDGASISKNSGTGQGPWRPGAVRGWARTRRSSRFLFVFPRAFP